MPKKSSSNRFNLNHGLAFAYRVGDLVENTVGKTIEKSRLEAPLLEGEPQTGPWYRVPIEEGIAGDGSDYYIYIRRGKSSHLCIFFSGGGVAWNEYTAARPVTAGKLTAGMPNYYWNNLRPFTQLMNIHIGITDTLNPLNPFCDWSFVIVTYATGDFHVGDSVFSVYGGGRQHPDSSFPRARQLRSGHDPCKTAFPGPGQTAHRG